MHVTTPVETTVEGFRNRRGAPVPSEVSVALIMGSEFKKTHYPTPTGNVKLRQVPARYIAVQSFHGQMPNQKVAQRRREAVVNALRHAYSPSGRKFVPLKETVLLGYHDPFLVPGVIRKNEVGVVVEEDQTELIRVLTTHQG